MPFSDKNSTGKMHCVKVTMWSGMQCMTLSSTFTMDSAFYDPPGAQKHCKIFAWMSLLQAFYKVILDRMASRFSETGRTMWS